MFNEEVREKKRIGKNIFNRVSTRRIGSIYVTLPSDNLSKRQLINLNGEVETKNMWDNVTYEELLKMSDQERLNCITFLKHKYGMYRAVDDLWKLRPNTIATLRSRSEANLKKENVTRRKYTRRNTEGNEMANDTALSQSQDATISTLISKRESFKFSARWEGSFEGKELVNRLTSMGLVVVEDKKYRFFAELREID